MTSDFTIGISNPLVIGANQTGNVGYIEFLPPSSAGTATGLIMKGGSSSGCSVGDVVYCDTSGVWKPAKANAVSTSNGLIGIYLGDPLSVGILLRGTANISGFTGATGQPVYIDETTAGVMTSTRPTTTGEVVRLIGHSLHGISGLTNMIQFNPDQSWIEL
jgi:hypothetical protein